MSISTRRPRSPAPISLALASALASTLVLTAGPAQADEPIVLRDTFEGNLDFVITGATMAADTDDDNKVDAPAQPAMATLPTVPDDAVLVSARLYWAASISPSMCEDEGKLDDEVDFTAPDQPTETVMADGCYCSVGAQSYDMQVCFADVTDMIVDMKGDYSVDGLDALLDNGDTHNASFALAMVYEADGVSPRRVGLYDGLTTMVKSVNPKTTVSLEGIEVDNPPQGEIAWYTLEGDVNGNKDEFVEVSGQPGAKTHTPTDADNPANNPFNQTINTSQPPQTGVIGVDVDRFSISPALTAGDDSIDVTYSADFDKYWIAVNIIGVDVFAPALQPGSGKAWTLTDDADDNGEPTVGDTVTYTITLNNSGNAPATVLVTDMIPAQAASWAPGELCGGTLVEDDPQVFAVSDVEIEVDSICELTFTVVIDEVADETPMHNTAVASLGEDIDTQLVAPDALLRRDGDDDTVFDNDDNCPEDANEDQLDEDENGIGDACEGDPPTSGSDSDGSTGSASDSDGSTGTSDGETVGTSDSGTSDSGSGSGGVETLSASASGSASASASASATASDSSATAGEETDSGGVDDSGCGCQSNDKTPAPWMMAIGVVGLALRRRR